MGSFKGNPLGLKNGTSKGSLQRGVRLPKSGTLSGLAGFGGFREFKSRVQKGPVWGFRV